MKNKNQWFLGMSVVLALSACGKTKDESPKSGSAVAQQGDWIQLRYHTSSDGSVVFDEKQLSQQGLEKRKQFYQRANLIQIPVDGRFNAQVFRITDGSISDYNNKLFVAPKLFSYGSQQSGRLGRIKNQDGTITLIFNIAFVDGTTKTIQSPQADEKSIVVPNSFVVNDPTGLTQVLRSDYHSDNGLSPLPGCPKKVLLTTGLKSYDVTPQSYKDADFCQLNTPVTVSIRLPENEAKRILEEDLYSGLVDVSGVYETRVSIPVVKVAVSFDRSKISRDLRMKLGVKAFFTDIEVQKAMTSVIQKELMKVAIQGEPSENVAQLVKQATEKFFEPLTPDAKNPQSECSGVAVCLRYSEVSVDDSRTLELGWSQDTNSIIGQSYVTSTKLKATPNKITIGKERDCTENCERLVNDGKPRETGLTVQEGMTVVLEPSYVVREYKVSPPESTIRTNHDVNIRFGVANIKQNQWFDTTTVRDYSIDQIVDQPVGLLDHLYDSLFFEFTYVDTKSRTKVRKECPVLGFPIEGNGRSLTIQLVNSPACQIFTKDPNEVPLLSIVNRIGQNDFLDFQFYQKIVYWDGRVELKNSASSHPRKVEFAGSISILGGGIESEDPREQAQFH
jgi:hypothetical protein